MNYTELVSQIQDQLEYSETSFVAAIPDFVKRAEERIYRMVQIPDLRRIKTTSLTVSDEFLTLPDDYLSTYSLGVLSGGQMDFLLNKEYEFMREAYPDPSSTGSPKYYAVVDDAHFILAPTPDAAYTVEMYYFYKPDSIVTTSTSWLGDNAGNALFWGSVVEGYKYMKGEDDLMSFYENSFSEAMAELKVLTEGRNRKGFYRNPDERISL